jgi:hypothetical protein
MLKSLTPPEIEQKRTTRKKELNGWNLDAMTEATEGFKEQPEAGKVT